MPSVRALLEHLYLAESSLKGTCDGGRRGLGSDIVDGSSPNDSVPTPRPARPRPSRPEGDLVPKHSHRLRYTLVAGATVVVIGAGFTVAGLHRHAGAQPSP